MQLFRYWFTRSSRKKFNIHTLLCFAIFVGITRGILENLLFGTELQGSDILGFIPFYFSLPFIYASLISLIPGIKYSDVLQPVTFATLLGILPPILDFVIGAGKSHSVFYGYFLTHDFGNFPWLGYAPEHNYPLGEAITIWLTFLLVSMFIYHKKRSFFYAFLGLIPAYASFLLFSLVIPGCLSFLFFGYVADSAFLTKQSTAKLRQILFLMSAAQIFLAWLVDSSITLKIFQYAKRILHFLPFLLLTLLGASISGTETKATIIAMLITTCSGIIVIAQNDFLRPRRKTDVKNYATEMANITAIIIYVMTLFSGYKFALFGIACFVLSILYHYETYNIRQTLFGSMKIEGLWGAFTFLTGIFSGPIIHPNPLAITVSMLTFGGFSLFSILKDAKDMRSDRREGRNTIYTMLFRKKLSIRMAHRVLGAILGTILIGTGILYYPLMSVALVVHVLLSLLLALVLQRIYRIFYFQTFMFIVCCVIINMIFYLQGHPNVN